VAAPTIFLLFSVLSSTGIFLLFRLIDKRETGIFPVIVINYIVASGLGYTLAGGISHSNSGLPLPFYGLAVIIGVLFILMFFVLGRSSQKAGMSITSVAGKMSVIFPIAFSLLYDPDDMLSVLKLAGILLVLPGVLMTVFKKKTSLPGMAYIYLPLLLFAGMGLVDSFIKLAQYKYVSEENLSFFTAVLFSISALIGLTLSLMKRNGLRSLLQPKVLIWGSCLGLVNFGSIYFLVRALNFRDPLGNGLDSSVVFGINNIGIVCLSVLLGRLAFSERLSLMNKTGIFICLLATVILAIST